MVFDMSIVRFEISQVMSANFTTDSVFRLPIMSLHVLFNRVLCSEGFRTNVADLDVVRRVRVILKRKFRIEKFSVEVFCLETHDMMFQSCWIHEFLATILHHTLE